MTAELRDKQATRKGSSIISMRMRKMVICKASATTRMLKMMKFHLISMMRLRQLKSSIQASEGAMVMRLSRSTETNRTLTRTWMTK